MRREPLDSYDVLPPAMENYLRHYGRHFSEAMCKFAVSKMYRMNGSSKQRIEFTDKDRVYELLSSYGIHLENDMLYDAVFVYNMAVADFYGSSLTDERNLCLFVKDYIDDTDQADGFVFNRFYSDCVRKGLPIPWDECL